jgi:predicted nucleic acid-binding Zn ribbon protein
MTKIYFIDPSRLERPRRSLDPSMRMSIHSDREATLSQFPSMRRAKAFQSYMEWKEEQDKAEFKDILLDFALSDDN